MRRVSLLWLVVCAALPAEWSSLLGAPIRTHSEDGVLLSCWIRVKELPREDFLLFTLSSSDFPFAARLNLSQESSEVTFLEEGNTWSLSTANRFDLYWKLLAVSVNLIDKMITLCMTSADFGLVCSGAFTKGINIGSSLWVDFPARQGVEALVKTTSPLIDFGEVHRFGRISPLVLSLRKSELPVCSRLWRLQGNSESGFSLSGRLPPSSADPYEVWRLRNRDSDESFQLQVLWDGGVALCLVRGHRVVQCLPTLSDSRAASIVFTFCNASPELRLCSNGNCRHGSLSQAQTWTDAELHSSADLTGWALARSTACLSPRKLQASHFSAFSVQRTLLKSETQYVTFENTHSSTQRVTIDVYYFGQGCINVQSSKSGTTKWTVCFDGFQSLYYTPSNSTLAANGGIAGTYKITIAWFSGGTSSYELRVRIECTATPSLCYCASSGQFPNPKTSSCSACPSGSTTCQNYITENCMPASPTDPYTPGFFCDKCLGRTFDSTSGKCVCFASCKTCQNTGNTDCLSCVPHATAAGAFPTSCTCDAGYWLDTDNMWCTSCHAACLTCVSGSIDQCQSCKANASLAGTPPAACTCVAGYGTTADNCKVCDSTCQTCSGCTCNDSYYPGSSANCVVCDITCATCAKSDSQSCLSCKSGASLVGGLKPYSCACSNGYFGTADSCTPCHKTCLKCTSQLSNACTVCYSGATLSSSSCTCDSGRYYDEVAALCLACNTTCKECISSTTATCTDCKAGAQLSATAPASCVCSQGYFPSTTPASCVACDVTCLACTKLGTAGCSSCKTHAHLAGSSPTSCLCDTGFFPNSNPANCAACDALCAVCTAAGSCTSCVTNSHMQTSSCACNSGRFPNTSTNSCDLCSSLCLACAASSASDCTSCSANAKLASIAPSSCVCSSGFGPNPNVAHCTACDSSCSECVGVTADACTVCVDANAAISGSSGSCLCKTGFFSSSGVCVACSGLCGTCQSAAVTSCLSCKSSAVLQGSPPAQCACSPGSFLNTTSGECRNCHSLCLTCSQGSAASQCDSCKANATLRTSIPSFCDCASGFYRETTTGDCVPCTAPCKDCTGPSECSSCWAFSSLQSGTCVCNDNAFLQSGLCQLCPGSCAKCISAAENSCTSCNTNAQLSAASPASCICSIGFYGNPSAANCAACLAPCKECVGGLISQCTACFSGAQLSGVAPATCVCSPGFYSQTTAASCMACDLTCLTCVSAGASGCDGCKTEARLSGSSPSPCVCNDGFFPDPDSSVCSACDAICTTCSAANSCKSCKPNAVLQGGMCLCDTGYFQNADSCAPCSVFCRACVGAADSDCASCLDHSTLSGASPSSCVCSSGFAANPDVAHCAPCNPSCADCTGVTADSCTSCVDVNANVSPLGFCVCNDGFFSSLGVCLACSVLCETCVGGDTTDCLSCKAGAMMEASSPSRCVCGVGLLLSPDTGECLGCHNSCLTCRQNIASQCESCKVNAVLRLPAPNFCDCMSGFYAEATTGNCVVCHLSCKECSGPSAAECTNCWPYSSLQSGSCVCDSNAFLANDRCQKCHDTCSRCSAGAERHCTECFLFAGLEGGAPLAKCVCIDGYFPSPTSATCKQCDPSCVLCAGDGPRNCESCHDFAEVKSPPGICQCASDAFLSAKSCVPCAPSCLTCASADSCLSCKQGAELSGSSPSLCTCKLGFFPDPSPAQCSPCQSTCAKCVSQFECVECKSNSLLKSGLCECLPGYYRPSADSMCVSCGGGCVACDSAWCSQCEEGLIISEGSCVGQCPIGSQKNTENVCEGIGFTPPALSLSVSETNSLLLNFDKPMNCSLSAEDIAVEIATSSDLFIGVTWTNPVFSDSVSAEIALSFDSTYVPMGCEATLTFYSPERVVDQTGIAIDVSTARTALLPMGEPPVKVSAIADSPIGQQAAASVKGGVSASATASAINGSPSSLISTVNQFQLIAYLSFSSLPLPNNFTAMIGALNTAQMLPNPLITWLAVTDDSQKPPPRLAENGIDTTLFLPNVASFGSLSVIVLLSYGPIYLLAKVKNPVISRYFRRFLPSFRWSLPLTTFSVVYLDLGIYSLLQAGSASFATAYLALNSLLAYALLLLFLTTPLALSLFSYYNESALASRADEAFNVRWKLLLQPFSRSDSEAGLRYYSLFAMRRLVLAFSIFFTTKFPLAFALLNITSSLAVVSKQVFLFVSLRKPFAERWDQLEATVVEGGTLSTYLVAGLLSVELGALAGTMENLGIWVVRGVLLLSVVMPVLKLSLGIHAAVVTYRATLMKLKGVKSAATKMGGHSSFLPASEADFH